MGEQLNSVTSPQAFSLHFPAHPALPRGYLPGWEEGVNFPFCVFLFCIFGLNLQVLWSLLNSILEPKMTELPSGCGCSLMVGATQSTPGWEGAPGWEECRKLRQLNQNSARLDFHPIITDRNPFREPRAGWCWPQMAQPQALPSLERAPISSSDPATLGKFCPSGTANQKCT